MTSPEDQAIINAALAAHAAQRQTQAPDVQTRTSSVVVIRNPSKSFWLDLLQHMIRVFAVSMMSALAVSSAGTAGGYLPVTQVDWLGGLYIGLTGAFVTVLLGLTSCVIPGADPDSISFFPPKPPAADAPTSSPPQPAAHPPLGTS